MTYLSREDLEKMNFKYLGKNVLISDKASIYNANQIEVDDNSRIDDFCVLSGRIHIGKFNHITPMCLIAGGVPGVFFGDFCTLAYGVKIFSQSDDYSGNSLTNSLIAKKFKNEIFEPVFLKKHVIIGANSTIFPGVTIEEGCSIGAMTLVTKSTSPWGIYIGIPAIRIKDRSKHILNLEIEFLAEKNDSI